MTIEEIKKYEISELEKDSTFKSQNPIVQLDPKLQKGEEEKNQKNIISKREVII